MIFKCREFLYLMTPYILLFIAVMIFLGLVVHHTLTCEGADSGINIVINDTKIGEKGILVDDTTLVPVRGVFEQLDFSIEYDETTSTAILQNDDYLITVTDGDNVIYVNGEKVTPPVAQQIQDGHFLLPLRTIAESIDADVKWDSDTSTVYIDTQTSSHGVLADPLTDPMAAVIQTAVDYTNPENNTETATKYEDTDFTLKINKSMPKTQNYVFSPLSIKYALAMVANGADEETKAEILDVLGVSDLNSFNDDVKAAIESYSKENLNIANSMWLIKDRIAGGDFSESFKKLIMDKYVAESEALNQNEAVSKINNWCADKTNNKINQIITNDDIKEALSLLVNAVYFNGRWLNEFSEESTYEGAFTDAEGKETMIDFMHLTDHFDYYADEDINMISLPYKGSNISMYIVLADNEDIDPEKYIDKMSSKNVKVSIPKFKVEYSEDLSGTLMNLGMISAFDSNASHFKPMFNDAVNNTTGVRVDKVIHKAYIDVNEKGTEAAAVTAAVMQCNAMMVKPEETVVFKADKPFTYFIRDNATNEVLFMGRYAFAE